MIEALIQREVNAYLRQRSVLYLHLEAGGSGRGARRSKGVPDLLMWSKKGAFALELKSPGGKLRSEQAEWMARFKSAGGVADVAYSLEGAIKFIDANVI